MNDSPTGFRPANTLSIVVVICLALLCISEALALIMGIAEMVDPLRVIVVGGKPNSPWLLAQGMAGLVQGPLYVATPITFLIWLFRVYKNLDSLENQQYREFTPGWAIGWWFVPFAALVKPFQVMREAWFDSNPEIETEQTFLSASLRSAPTYLGFWWGMFLASRFLSSLPGAFANNIKDFSDLAMVGFFFVLGSGLSIAAGVLCIKLVRDITSRQEQRFANLQLKHSYEPPPPPTFVSSTF